MFKHFFQTRTIRLLQLSTLLISILFFSACQKESINTLSENSIEPTEVSPRSEGGIKITAKVFLDGAFIGGVSGGAMTTDLYDKNLIPNYSNITNPPATDWVKLQLFEEGSNSPIESKDGLVLPNGDVVDAQGYSVFHFSIAKKGNLYHVAIIHRNHLDCKTGLIYFPNNSDNAPPFSVDFSSISTPIYTPTYNEWPRRNRDGIMTLWMGDECHTGVVGHVGFASGCIEDLVMSHPGNTNGDANYIVHGYHNEDLNLNGEVIFQGPGNDRALKLTETIFPHPGNTTGINHVVVEAMN